MAEAEEKQSNHALYVALASAAAAEAAVAAAHAAVEVVRLTSIPQSMPAVPEQTEEPVSVEAQTEDDIRSTGGQHKRQIKESSAVKIQTAFRGYLVSGLSNLPPSFVQRNKINKI